MNSYIISVLFAVVNVGLFVFGYSLKERELKEAERQIKLYKALAEANVINVAKSVTKRMEGVTFFDEPKR